MPSEWFHKEGELAHAPMLIVAVLAVGAAVGQAAGAAQGGAWSLEVTDRLERYRIEGRTARELREQLKDHGPRSGLEGHGRTHSEFQLEYELVPGQDQCRVDGRAIRLVITTTIPEWLPPERVPEELVEHWRAAEAALVLHERGHRDHAAAAGESLAAALSRLPPGSDCKRAWTLVEREFERAMWKLRQQGIRYDRRTGNGSRPDPLEQVD